MSQLKSYVLALTLGAIPATAPMAADTDTNSSGYAELVQLYAEWRDFESPPLLDGAPDYTARTFVARRPAFEALQVRLNQLDVSAWPITQQVDWQLVRAEMNGYDFSDRVLMPWVRDPAFYNSVRMARSDVPAHEGPNHHALVDVWAYEFPLDAPAEQKLLHELAVIPPLMQQARGNLTGNARELWVTGIRDIRAQSESLETLKATIHPDGFNVGVNLGKVAGAGLEEHVHLHVVPRWDGDTNFMPVMADVKVIPQSLLELWDELHPSFSA